MSATITMRTTEPSSSAPFRRALTAPEGVTVERGPALLSGVGSGPSLAAHRGSVGPMPDLTLDQLLAATSAVGVRGRGGAGFPFGIKLKTVVEQGSRRPVVVVNIAEGEPASAKDTALATLAPHRILDGASLVARALGCRGAHIVVPSERPAVGAAIERALLERRDEGDRLTWTRHQAAPGFVSGQARAVLELMAGRPNLPVTAWTPEAISGHRRRPTLLSNAETWAHVGELARVGATAYAERGTPAEPGTTLLTIHGHSGQPKVVEVEHGTPFADVLTDAELRGPLLLGGYHGTWVRGGALRDKTVSRAELAAAGYALGAGVILAMCPGECPVDLTARIVEYLAGESARRCGPCLNGLPVLSGQMSAVARGASGDVSRVEQLVNLVERRGACAHPDGTARLVRTLFAAYSDDVSLHARGACGISTIGRAR